MGRREVSWSQVVISLPNDGTGALPVLRHVILNDAKSSTYKLALLRVLCRIADSASGLIQDRGDDYVAVPLGLVGLYWVRAYRPLLDEDLPQQPGNKGLNGLGFAKGGYRSLGQTSSLDLRPGIRFSGERAKSVQLAIREAVNTIVGMPVRYMTGADGLPLLTPIRRPSRLADPVTIDGEYLRSLGELRVPRHLWRALVRFGSWIEPALVSEWVRLMLGYAARQGRTLDESAMRRALVWSDPERDVSLARRRAAALLEHHGAIYCVWSGKRLKAATLDMDHCFPWTAWPCDGLWNLLPASRQINQREKRARLPAAERLEEARARIQDWWQAGYVSDDRALRRRFFTEAISALPAAAQCSLDDVFEGVMTQRVRLKEDQQVPEW